MGSPRPKTQKEPSTRVSSSSSEIKQISSDEVLAVASIENKTVSIETKSIKTNSTSSMLAFFWFKDEPVLSEIGFNRATIDIEGIDGTPEPLALQKEIEKILLNTVISSHACLSCQIMFLHTMVHHLDKFLTQQLQGRPSQTSNGLFVGSKTDRISIFTTTQEDKPLVVSKDKTSETVLYNETMVRCTDQGEFTVQNLRHRH